MNVRYSSMVLCLLLSACGDGDVDSDDASTQMPDATGSSDSGSDSSLRDSATTDTSMLDSSFDVGAASDAGMPDARPPTGPVPFLVTRYERGHPELFPEVINDAPEPALGACFEDSAFQASVCKVMDANYAGIVESGGVVRPVYSRVFPDNADGSLYLLTKTGESPHSSGRGQGVMMNGDDSFARNLSEINSHEMAELRWDATDPNRLYYRSGCELRALNVATMASTTLRDFSSDVAGCRHIRNDVEGEPSSDSRYWAFMVFDGSFNVISIITYDLAADRILGNLDQARYEAMGGSGSLRRPNMVDISPNGMKIVALWGRTNRNDIFDGPHAYNLDFSGPVKVCNDETHSGWAFDYDGNQVYVCQVNNANWPGRPADTIVATNILSGESTVLAEHADLGWGQGFHFGRIEDPAIRGWIYMNTYTGAMDTSWARNQAMMWEIRPMEENPRVWRIADFHGFGGDYQRENHAPITRDGQTIFVGSDWRGGDGTVDTYRIDLPERWWVSLASE